MYYRYEARRTDEEDHEFKGIFHIFTPSQRRKWYCLAVPKWYEKNPNVESQAWFTQHGYNKWHETMEEMILEFLDWFAEGTYEIRLLKKRNAGKCCLQRENTMHYQIASKRVCVIPTLSDS